MANDSPNSLRLLAEGAIIGAIGGTLGSWLGSGTLGMPGPAMGLACGWGLWSLILIWRPKSLCAGPGRRVAALATLFTLATVAVFLFTGWAQNKFESKFNFYNLNKENKVRISILQLNDVYEMEPLNGFGGLARVASLRKQLLAQTPNTIAVLAGDLVSPSALSLAMVNAEVFPGYEASTYDGPPKKKLSGVQMIAAMNTLGLDVMTFGNHEFDLEEWELLERLAESRFQWISANVLRADGQPFPGVKPYVVKAFAQGDRVVRVGLFGLTIVGNPKPYRLVSDPRLAAEDAVRLLREQEKVDIVIALTHLAKAEDQVIAAQVSGIDLIIGGHEHENIQFWYGRDFIPVYKADANARTVYVHDLTYDLDAHKLEQQSRLIPIDQNFMDDAETKSVVDHWRTLAFASFGNDGINAAEVIALAPVELDGMEASVRNGPTALTQIVAQSFLTAFPEAEASIFNSGSIRIDDTIYPGYAITRYDVMRILPFGGVLVEDQIPGSLLLEVLTRNFLKSGTGSYPQMAGIARAPNGQWLMGSQPIDPKRTYTIATSEYFLSTDPDGFKRPEGSGKRGISAQQALANQLAGN